jgi:hypothetical protein
MRKPKADVPDEVGASDDDPSARTPRKRADGNKNDGHGDQAEIQILREFVDGLKSKGLSLEGLQKLISKINDEYPAGLSHNKPIKEGYAPSNDAWDDLDNNVGRVAGRFNELLDNVMHELTASPDLEETLRAHALFSKFTSIAKKIETDPVAAEIAREVTIRWEDRKKPEFKGLPWTKNASTFIAHVYAKWYSKGVLKQSHLTSQGKLYNAYYGLIAREPKWNLNLPRKEYAKLEGPEQAIEHYRRKARESSKRHALKKKIT